MKKLSLLFVLMLTLFCITACSTDVPEETESENVQNTLEENINPDAIQLSFINGLNEQIHLQVTKTENEDFTVFYKAKADTEYKVLDRELMLEYKGVYDCYILGLPKGLYDVRIEQGEGENFARKTVTDIDVEKQDRSGYAHFNREEGIGGYNNDGSVKENAKILYLTNENKNTISLDIGGTTYTGLVAILQANQYMEDPLIIRVLDKITTNQWEPKDSPPRMVDNPIPSEEYFDNKLSKNGENLIGLPVEIYDRYLGKCYQCVTTADGLEHVGTTDTGISTALNDHRGVFIGEHYNDETVLNTFRVDNASNITIEGVGQKAMFYQFGVHFYYSDSIEVRNMTFSQFPVDGLGFLAYGESSIYHGNFWVHHNTFKRGNNVWAIGGYAEPGDEAVDLADVHNITIAYNKFDRLDKAVLIGGWEYDACKDITFHHNYYAGAGQRMPMSRNANIHNYNNYFVNCGSCMSPRTNSYYFNEANYFESFDTAYYFVATETRGAIKSYGDIYLEPDGTEAATIVTDREAYVENTCKPDWVSDYSRFDTDPELFYYDAENKCSDVDILLPAEDVPEFVRTYAGAGVYVRMDISEQ